MVGGTSTMNSRCASGKRLLRQGRRVAAVGGSDSHGPHQPVGLPQTVVHAADLSVPSLVEGLRRGRCVHRPITFCRASVHRVVPDWPRRGRRRTRSDSAGAATNAGDGERRNQRAARRQRRLDHRRGPWWDGWWSVGQTRLGCDGKSTPRRHALPGWRCVKRHGADLEPWWR